MRLIGRDRELHELKSALVEHRLVTVCGPAGVGKTRLVQEVLGSGAHYCSLSGVETLAELDRALLTALGAPSWDKGMTLTAPRALARALRPLVIDGVDAVANLVRSCVEHWLEQASQVRLVVTGLAP
ncbi:MAG TPA: AAA family ATPase, partial [Polyangiaceae bacterium]|nr:AAA family ATPase [Polyangiaceae bacterium]